MQFRRKGSDVLIDCKCNVTLAKKRKTDTMLVPNTVRNFGIRKREMTVSQIRNSQTDPFQINDLIAYYWDREAGKA